MIKFYFDRIYSPVYDFTTARLVSYEKLQNNCIEKLELKNGERVLCAGVGTGNEITRIYRNNPEVEIIGVDYSARALDKAVKKAREAGKKLDTHVMDVRDLEQESACFDKVLCIHVMDFLGDHRKATSEIFRILRDDGRFVITYPSAKEGLKLGVNLFRHTIRNRLDTKADRIRNAFGTVLQMLASTVYIPLLFRSKRISYTHDALEKMLSGYPGIDFMIEEDPDYQDFIVYGIKTFNDEPSTSES